ncbi:hypothetical protein D9B78_14745 [Serratia marcescens]|nr:hypothetical protein D9B78_14745 [Serratia marcescens]
MVPFGDVLQCAAFFRIQLYGQAALTAQDLAAHSSPAALAALICQRSPEAGRHAKTLLAALAPQH